MASARALLRSWLALALIGCADSGSISDDEVGEDTGDGDGEGPLPEVGLRCAAASAPELAAIGGFSGTLDPRMFGPCGHLAYHDDQGQGWLIAPDGARSELEHLGYDLVFAPSGELMAWERDLDGGLTLRDLLGGGERVLDASGTTDAFGFVPRFAEPSFGSWLWSCEDGLLERHDPDTSEMIAESVVCGSVVGSLGSPRIAYADQAGRVWIADLDSDEVIGSDDLEYAGYDGSKRDDTLWLDYEGAALLHVGVEWQGDPDVDSEWPVELWSRLVDHEGALLLDEPSLRLQQAPRRGAPVFVLDQGTIRRLDAGALSSVDAGLDSIALAGSGELFYTTEADAVLALELDATLPPTAIAELDTPVALRPSNQASRLALAHHSGICIVDALGECDRILLALRLWDRQAGLDPRRWLSTSPWNLVATLEEGDTLAIGAPVEAEGPTYAGEVPSPRVLWLDQEGVIQAELPAGNGGLAIRQSFELGQGRVLFEYQSELGKGELMLARSGSAGFSSLAPEVDVALLQALVDARAERVAFVAEGSPSTLWFGALPQ